jgi:hypothetical protein
MSAKVIDAIKEKGGEMILLSPLWRISCSRIGYESLEL